MASAPDPDELAAMPWAIIDLISGNAWLKGALLSVMASVLACIGLVLMKKAQYRIMGDKLSPTDPTPGWGQLLRSPMWWTGFALFLGQSPFSLLALHYAKETTVVPLTACLVLLNFCLAFGVLYERFTRRDILSTLICIIGIVVMSVSLSKKHKGEINSHHISVQDVLDISRDLFVNTGFGAYIVVWFSLFAMSLYMVCFVTMKNVVKPLALPLLVGLLSAFFHFTSKVSLTLIHEAETKPAVWNDPLTSTVVCTTVLLYIFRAIAAGEALRQLSCRYFVPAMYVFNEALVVTEDLLFFKSWEYMSSFDIGAFIVGCSVSLISLNYISWRRRVLPSPHFSELNSPLLSPKENAVHLHKSIIEIMNEYKVRVPDAKNPAPLGAFDMNIDFSAKWRYFPIFITVFLLCLPCVLWGLGYTFSAFVFLTLFSVYQGWKMGAFIALFAYVGIKKIAHYDKADFHALWEAELAEAPETRRKIRWEDIVHFVVLPNYNESIEDLSMSIKSIGASGIAKKQIVLVLAMEEREKGGKEKADELIRMYKGSFRTCLATYHPQGLKGEVPGKSANTRWATERIFDTFLPQSRIDSKNVVLTVGDADSEFHAEYFAALTYYFLHAGGEENQTPLRYLTIWQPPILHLKNYITQPAVIRLASFITSQHELANLADPNAARVPYSTYSISATLAQGVGGWDPDWISEDWHMALKCFLSSGTRIRITPIFLPILNYTPSAPTFLATMQARWIQAKRHALGFSEIVYLHEHIPRILRLLSTHWERAVFLWRIFFVWMKLLMIHIFMAIFFVVAPLNGTLIAFFDSNQMMEALNINSWTFLINCVFQAIGIIAFICIFMSSVLLFELVRDRIDGADSPDLNITWRNRPLHFLTVVPQSIIYLPLFFVLAGAAEWIAAFKTAGTKGGGFKYVTATEGARKAAGKE
eukprot:TRINITY_DN71384_c0_g1_i1.p1 TRINITY_DN71384_c0_g1~~TRINITY_DN71384_c0_g1_i1.p1  ORF type:complete len:927 (-),score=200.00 TRINITY_DN71384_c0_g1_i1:163-2943(-)